MKNTAQRLWDEKAAWLGLAVIILAAGLIRYRLLPIPLERDEGEYAYAAQLLLHGMAPYKSVYTMKFPGTFVVYAVFLKFFGQTDVGIHTGFLLLNACTILLIFLLAKRFTGRLGALAAAGSFALFSVSQSVEGTSANAEHFVLPFAIGGLLLLLTALKNNRPWILFWSGVVFGIGFTMKQHGAFFLGVGLIWIAIDAFPRRPVPWRAFVFRCMVFCAGAAAVYAMLCLILAWSGVFSSFWLLTVRYGRRYLVRVPLNDAWAYFTGNGGKILASAPALWALVGLGALTLVLKKDSGKDRLSLAVYFLFSFLSVCPGFYFREHYFVLLLPASALLVAVGVSALETRLRVFLSRGTGTIAFLLVLFCFCVTLYGQRDILFRMTPDEISRSSYGLNPFVEAPKIAAFLKERTTPTDRIVVLGSEPEIYFYAQRLSGTSYIYMYYLMRNMELALDMQKEMIRQIEASRPPWIVYVGIHTSWLNRTTSHGLVFQWMKGFLAENYVPKGVIEIFDDRTLYHWAPNIKWPPLSPYWITLYSQAR